MSAKSEMREKIRRWEEQNIVQGKGYYDKYPGVFKSVSSSMNSKGYDAYRISPNTTTKFGLKYKAVYGAQVDMTRYGLRVNWYKQGYIPASRKIKSGTRLLTSIGSYAKNQSERDILRSQFMLKPKSRYKGRR